MSLVYPNSAARRSCFKASTLLSCLEVLAVGAVLVEALLWDCLRSYKENKQVNKMDVCAGKIFQMVILSESYESFALQCTLKLH